MKRKTSNDSLLLYLCLSTFDSSSLPLTKSQTMPLSHNKKDLESRNYWIRRKKRKKDEETHQGSQTLLWIIFPVYSVCGSFECSHNYFSLWIMLPPSSTFLFRGWLPVLFFLFLYLLSLFLSQNVRKEYEGEEDEKSICTFRGVYILRSTERNTFPWFWSLFFLNDLQKHLVQRYRMYTYCMSSCFNS